MKPGLLVRVGVAVAVSLGLARVARGQPTLGEFTDSPTMPDTPVAKLAQRVIDVINSGDPEQVGRLVDETFAKPFRDSMAMGEHLATFAQFRDASGGYDFVAVRNYQPPRPANELVVIVKTRTGGAYRGMQFAIDDQAPPRLASFMISPARPPKDAPRVDVGTDEKLADALKRYVEELASRDAFSGAVLLARDGKPLLELATGLADRKKNVSNTMDTPFNLASMGKMFTGVAAAQLVEKGKLAFDDPVSKHLSDDWLSPSAANRIRVGQLLSHTSGLGDFLTRLFQEGGGTYASLDDFRPLVRDESPRFEPGTQSSYSNTGFLLAGAVIEKAAGSSYYDYVRRNIFAPAGMEQSAWRGVGETSIPAAIGYSRVDAGGATRWSASTPGLKGIGTSAGGAVSSARDLLKFDQALRGGKLLKPETLRLLWSAKPASPNYGYGFGVFPVGDDVIVGHTGGIMGVSAFMEIYVRSGYTIIILANRDNVAETVGEFARGLVNERIRSKP